MAGSLFLIGELYNLPTGTWKVNSEIPGNSSNLTETLSLVLSSGSTTVDVPSWAVGVVLTPASTMTAAPVIDSGFSLGIGYSSSIYWGSDSSVESFTLTVDVDQTDPISITFI